MRCWANPEAGPRIAKGGPVRNELNTMNEMPTKLKFRAERKTKKRDEKKRLIAKSAIEAMKELGYANTSLRDITANSDLSLGMLHYYFEDKADLIIYCVRVYKEDFVHNIFEALEGSQGRKEVTQAFSEALADSIIDDGATHALWYDIRTQAIFDETFQPVVAEIGVKLVEIVRTAFQKAGQDEPDDIGINYALLDGVFRYLMQHQITGTPKPRQELVAIF